MPEQQIPSWGDDPLSALFVETEYNERASAINLEPIYAVLQHVHAVFQRVEETVERDNREELVVSRILMTRTHSSFIAAIRLAMSGQIPESYPSLRAVIEQAWYALHLAKDPQPPNRVEIWLRRNDNEASKSQCKREFTIANVRSTHEALDPNTATQLHQIYETTIDFGGHPNQRGVLAAMNRPEADRFQVGILFINTTFLAAALRQAVAVAVGALKAFQLIFPERFEIMRLDEEINALERELNNVFRPYSQSSGG